MRSLKAFARSLLSLPASLRLWIVILCTLGCETIFILLALLCRVKNYPLFVDHPSLEYALDTLENNPGILALPVVVGAWVYRRNGLLWCLGSIMCMSWIFYRINAPSMLMQKGFVISFISGTVALLLIGLFVSDKSEALERVEESRRHMAWALSEEKRLHQEKDMFIQNVNHELKTPLTSLSASLEIMQQRQFLLDEEERADLLQNAIGSCDELRQLVGTILECLEVKALPAESLLLSATPLALEVREVVQQADSAWKLPQRTHLEIGEELLAMSQGRYLRQLLVNLLSNAVKFSSETQPILISARRTRHPVTLEPEVCLSVKDWGPGIPAEELSQLFGQFSRLSRDAMGRVRGSGLGLYISKHLVEAMGGRIWAESSGVPGEGSCFYFTLPAARGAPGVRLAPGMRSAALATSG